ncbi:Copia-like polyprotein/retrotransposon, partial [Thalictrum thalictroides]
LEKWITTDQLLLSWLNATLIEEVLAEVVGLSTSKDVWEKLENTFSQRSKAREYQLKQELQNCRQQQGESVHDFLRRFKRISDSLAAIGQPISDEDKVVCVLNGLLPAYDAFVTSVFARPPVPPYDELLPNLHGQEIRMKSRNTFDTAFFAKKNNSNFAGKQKQGEPFKGPHKKGDTKSTPGPSRPPIPSRFNDPSSCQVCGKREWYPDSGATSHMTNSEGSENGKDTGERK